MKLKRIYLWLIFFCFFASNTFSQNLLLVNEMSFSLNGINKLNICYDDENIKLFSSDTDNLLIKEFMTKKNKAYFANVKSSINSIYISEGNKPFNKKNFLRCVEIYLPITYSNELTISTTAGEIDMEKSSLNISTLNVNTTSGTISINEVNALKIYLTTTRGTISCNKLIGYIDYRTTHGNLIVKIAEGNGSYITENSGVLNVTYKKVNDNLYFFNKNGDTHLNLPNELEFTLDVTSKNGSIITDFKEDIKTERNSVYKTNGKKNSVKVKLESNNGNIIVNRF